MEYGLNDIDDHGCLKPGLAMILAALFLCRQWFYGPLTFLSERKSRASSGAEVDVSFIEVYSLWEFVACLPAVVVLVLLFRRQPTAGARVRQWWSRSRMLLIAAALMQLSVLLWYLISTGVDSGYFMALLFLHIYVLFYLFTSKRLQHAVGQFPTRKEDSSS